MIITDPNAIEARSMEIIESELPFPFEDGDSLSIKVNCANDAGEIVNPIKYAIAVSLELGEGVDVDLLNEINIYEEVRDRLRVPIRIANTANTWVLWISRKKFLRRGEKPPWLGQYAIERGNVRVCSTEPKQVNILIHLIQVFQNNEEKAIWQPSEIR